MVLFPGDNNRQRIVNEYNLLCSFIDRLQDGEDIDKLIVEYSYNIIDQYNQLLTYRDILEYTHNRGILSRMFNYDMSRLLDYDLVENMGFKFYQNRTIH